MGAATDKQIAKMIKAINIHLIKLLDSYEADNQGTFNKELLKENLKLLNQLIRKLDKEKD